MGCGGPIARATGDTLHTAVGRSGQHGPRAWYRRVTKHPLLLGESDAISVLRSQIARLAPMVYPVLIRGPRGSGKELVAHALHTDSGRSGAFVAFNVCAIPDTMFEDAMFGHVKGAFTGATTDAPGYLVEADRGTAFFDEVGGVSLVNQRKLLRALETKTFRPVGAALDRHSDFRIIAATNDDLRTMVGAGEFRADVVDRLEALTITVPPLRQRLCDIPVLAQHFLRTLDPTRTLGLTDGALEALVAYDWPGNVRELRHVVMRLVALAPQVRIQADDVAMALQTDLPISRSSVRPERGASDGTLRALLMQVKWDTAKAAQLLGVARSTVYRRLARAGIAVNARRGRPVHSGAPHYADDAWLDMRSSPQPPLANADATTNA
jgi:DNA-binding NtrC family response regulator